MNRPRLAVFAPLRLALAFALSLSLLGCSSLPPLHVKANDPSTFAEARPGQPLVVELNEGDTIPLDFLIQGELLETRPAPPPILLVAKRRFFLKIDDGGVKTSVDGEHWNAARKKGSFAFGLGFTKEGTKATARITTPSYAP